MRPLLSARGLSGRVAVSPDEVELEATEAPARVTAGGLAAQPAADLERCTGVVVAVDVCCEQRRGKSRTITVQLDEHARDGVKGLLPQAERPITALDDLLDTGRVTTRKAPVGIGRERLTEKRVVGAPLIKPVEVADKQVVNSHPVGGAHDSDRPQLRIRSGWITIRSRLIPGRGGSTSRWASA